MYVVLIMLILEPTTVRTIRAATRSISPVHMNEKGGDALNAIDTVDAVTAPIASRAVIAVLTPRAVDAVIAVLAAYAV